MPKYTTYKISDLIITCEKCGYEYKKDNDFIIKEDKAERHLCCIICDRTLVVITGPNKE